MPIRTDCAHSYPVRSRRCRLSRGSCEGCRNFVSSEIERDPTGHPWILTTNKYYKNSNHTYEKGIITQGKTYTYQIMDAFGHYDLVVRRDNQVYASTRIDQPIRFGLVIKLGDAALRLLVSADIQEGKNHA